jgi:hypothetical protein
MQKRGICFSQWILSIKKLIGPKEEWGGKI